MSISIGPTPVLDDLILWYDAASYKCYSGEPTTNQLSQDYVGESGVATGDASINLSGLFGLGLISQRPWSHEVWSRDNINKGKLTRYGAYYFDGVNDYLEVPDDDAFTFGQDNVSVYTSDFSAGIDNWSAVQGTADGNIDSIGGQDNNLRLTVSTVNSVHYLKKIDILCTGKTYEISFDYYLPSTNSHLDSIYLTYSNGTPISSFLSTTDSWTSFSDTISAETTGLYIYSIDGGSNTFQDVGGDDVFYIRNVQITEVKDDLPFSISAWVRMEDATSAAIIGKYGGAASNIEWLFTLNASDQLVFLVYDAANNQPNVVSDNALTGYEEQWIHVAACYGGSGPNSDSAFAVAASEMTLYVNGQEVTSTASNNTSYTGISNTSQELRIGRGNSTYFEGHIKNVKIFNRELNAGEVYQLYYSNSLNGIIYSSDFSAGVDGWTGTNGTLSGNIDSIGGKNDNLRHTLNTSNAQHLIYKNALLSIGKNYHFSCEVYIPSTNSNLDGVNVYTGTSSSTLFVSATPTQDQWITISGNAVATSDYIYFYLMDGASNTFQDSGGDDVIYIRNINIVELDNQSLVDFADEWGEANGATYTSNFSAGVDGWVALSNITVTGNIDSIGGLNDTLRLVPNTANNIHAIYKSGLKSGRRYRISFNYYISSGNSNVDGFNLALGSGNFLGVHTATQDAWTYYEVEGTCTTASNLMLLYLTDGGSTVFQDAGGDDVMYVRDVKFTQIGTLADFDLSNYDDNDKITDRSSNKFVASPQGGALARERWFAHDLSFSKDTDNNDIATITRNPASGAFYENSNSLTLFGEHPLYVTNASTGDKVSVSLQVKSNQTGLFTGINFFNSGTSAHESILLSRVILPDDYEYIYGTSNLIATGDNVGFELLMNRDFSSGWNYINLKKPQIELKDHATNYVSLTRSGTNAIVNLANRNLYTGTIVNDVKSSGVAKIDGVQAYYPLSGGYWEFNGVDTSIDTNFDTVNFGRSLTFEVVFSANSASSEMVFGVDNDRPLLHLTSNTVRFSINTDLGQIDVDSVTSISTNTIYHAVATADEINGTGNLYLNGQFEKGYSFSTYNIRNGNNVILGDRRSPTPSVPLDGKIHLARFYKKALNSQEINHNYRSIKTKYGL